jgi:hypothetical protein
MQHDLWDKIWRDEHDRVVIFQMPNAWLIAWAVLTMISLATSHRVSDIFSWAGDISLVVWSVREITSGVNYFRRGLGFAVLAFCIAMVIKSF